LSLKFNEYEVLQMKNILLFTVFVAAVAAIIVFAPISASALGRSFIRTSNSSETVGNRIIRQTDFASPSNPLELPLLEGRSVVQTRSSQTDNVPEGIVVDAPVDLNGDGKTDYVVVRNTGGGVGGQLTWYYAQNGGPGRFGVSWGISTDWVISEDFDGDIKDDITVWRPAPAGQAAFYILLSATNTVRVDYFGQTGDTPSVIGDFDGDGKADTALFRNGPQVYWYYRGSFNNPAGNVTVVQWGASGDIPAPGDYDGDGKADFGIARNGGSGQLIFWRLLSTNVVLPVVYFGTTNDYITPGDYDGDGKTDIATVRSVSGQWQWQYLASNNGSINYQNWGGGNDYPTPGDYDGDGRTDVAIWRRSATPGQSAFWARQSSNGAVQVFSWGTLGDFPVADFNVF
jgi:hypothetical protein